MTSEYNMPPETASATPKWIEASLFQSVFSGILKDFKKTKNFKVIPALSAGENYSTVMLRLIAEIEVRDGSSKSITLMLKTAHESEVVSEMMKNHNLFDVENLMYREVVPELEQLYKEAGFNIKFAPQCYEIATEHPHLLLEDLKPQDYKNINRLEGLDMKHTQAVLTVLAQWHAASAVRVATKGKYQTILNQSFFKEENREMIGGVFGSLTEAFLKCAKTYEGHKLYYEQLYQHKDTIIDDMIEANILDENEFNVLNHGDCWSNNVMFRHDELGNVIDTYLVDYQLPHFGPPVQDLYYLLLSSTKYEIKIEKFDYFIKYYHDCLIKCLKLLKYTKKFPSLKDLHMMLHKYNARAYNVCTGIMAIVLLDPSDKAKLDNFLTESDDASEFKMQLFSSPRYRQHMEMLLPWLFYRGTF